MVVHLDDKWTDYQRVFYPNYYIITVIALVLSTVTVALIADGFVGFPGNFVAVSIMALPFIVILLFLKQTAEKSKKNPWKYMNIHIDKIIPQVDRLMDAGSLQYQRYSILEYAEKTGDLDAIKRIKQDEENIKSILYEINDGAETIIITEISNSNGDMTRIVIMPYEGDHIEVLDMIKNGIDRFSNQ